MLYCRITRHRQRSEGIVTMDSVLVQIIVQAVIGSRGGQAIGAGISQAAMGQLPKILSGGIGGIAGGQILGKLLSDPATASAMGGLLTNVVGGAGGGAILTAIVGAVMKSMNKSA